MFESLNSIFPILSCGIDCGTIATGFQSTTFSTKSVEARNKNQAQFWEVLIRLVNLMTNRFNWINLPETCNERALEQALIFYGKAIFFEHNISEMVDGVEVKTPIGIIHTPVIFSADYNIYFEPQKFEAYSYGFHESLTADEGVLVRNNPYYTPSIFHLITYAEKLSDASRAIDVHLQSLKRARFIIADEREVLTIKNAYREVEDNADIVIGSKVIDPDRTKLLNENSTSKLKEMWEHRNNLWAEILSFMGIDSVPHEKKERLLTQEIESANAVTEHNIEIMLKERKKACDLINAKYGLDIDVELNLVKESDYEDSKGGEINADDA